MQKQLEIYKERDFSSAFADTVNFLKANFGGILKSFILIVVPVYTLATVTVSFYTGAIINSMASPYSSGANIVTAIGSSFTLIWFLYSLAILLAITTLYAYIKVYSQKTDDSSITTGEVWKVAGKAALKLFLYYLAYAITFTVPIWLIFILFSMLMVALAVIPILGPLLIILVIIFLGLTAITFVSVLIPVIIYEKAGVYGSLSRAAALLKGSFWQTMGITVVAAFLVFLIVGGIAIVFTLIIQSFSTYTDDANAGLLKGLVLGYAAIAPLILFLGFIFQYSISGFVYYSLLEKLDHVGLRMQVESINTADNKPAEEY